MSYREDVIEGPDLALIGEPYYEPFEIPVMGLNEIVAEKLRTLAQRRRPTDLSDLAMVILGHEIDDTRVRALADRKFELVKDTDNRSRIERTIEAMRDQYDAASRLVPACGARVWR